MKKVFIVEKDPFTSDTLSQTLESFGYTSVIYEPQRDMVDQLIEFDPYIVMINIRIFKKNRSIFLPLINSGQKLFDACFIITSGELQDPEIIRQLGADFFLFKPYDLKTLSDLLLKVEVTKCHTA